MAVADQLSVSNTEALKRPSAPLGNIAAWAHVLFVAPVKPSLRKLPHMTWFGHCIVNVTTPLQASPSAGKLMLIS